MQRMHVRLRSGSRAEVETTGTDARGARAWVQESLEAEASDRLEFERAGARRARRALLALVPAALLAAVLAAVYPLTPGFSASDALAASVAAVVTAAAAVVIVPLGDRLLRAVPAAGAGDALVYAVALVSAGAAAIHFAVAKTHFDEYTLFGVFFVGSGIAQLVWPLWLMLRRWRPLLVLGGAGNAAIVALWAVDRIWGLPLGPTHWKPDPVGFGDTATSAFELLLVIGCIALLVRGPRPPFRRSIAIVLTAVVAAITALSLLSVLGVGSSFLAPTA